MPALILAGVHFFCTALAYWAVLGEDEEADGTIYHYVQDVFLCPAFPILRMLDNLGITAPMYSWTSLLLVILFNSLIVGWIIRLIWLFVATMLKYTRVQQGVGG